MLKHQIKNESLTQISHSETLLINELSATKIKSGENVVRFGFGQSPFLPPNHVIQALKCI